MGSFQETYTLIIINSGKIGHGIPFHSHHSIILPFHLFCSLHKEYTYLKSLKIDLYFDLLEEQMCPDLDQELKHSIFYNSYLATLSKIISWPLSSPAEKLT